MDQIGQYGAFGFWIFLAAVIVAGIWFDARKRESQQETLRRIVESGQHLDKDVLDKILAEGKDDDEDSNDLKVAAVIVLFVAPGLTALGWFMSRFNDQIMDVMLGVSALVAFVGIGLYTAGVLTERKNNSQG